MATMQDATPRELKPNGGSGVTSDPASQAKPAMKRNRILLSCAPCRTSKLKCDRQQPCGQCLKKERVDLCQYAPKPEKRKAATGMSARLKRLEGMVREMMDADPEARPALLDQLQGKQQQQRPEASVLPRQGQVIHGELSMTYFGATHCMAMLEDIEGLKAWIDAGEDEEDAASPEDDEITTPEFLLNSSASPRSHDELLSLLPERSVMDRLITRYFSSMSPSQHIVHRPSFGRMYAEFWRDPAGAPIAWVAQLFMMAAMGVMFSSYTAPHELAADSPLPPLDRIKHYRSCAGWALSRCRLSQPNMTTLAAFTLYVESHFVMDRASQMNCYILSGVCIRLMLKMGLHREPSKLANISPFEGEMRRRMWSLAFQVELLVSFHMGLPSMVQGIESDTEIPRHLQDQDFDEDSKELPPGRPMTEYTITSYAIIKRSILQVFSQIAKSAHSLSTPSYSEILRMDEALQNVWSKTPNFIRVKPLNESIGDPPILLIQRFGIGGIYNKSRCVLHRQYLAESPPQPDHSYSRRQCFEAALTLMDYQNIVWNACKPGNVLSTHGWFTASLIIHDFLLAAVCIYLVIKSDHYPEQGGLTSWIGGENPTPSKDELRAIVRRSHDIWRDLSTGTPELRKTADTLAIMLDKLGTPVNGTTGGGVSDEVPKQESASSVDGSLNAIPGSTMSSSGTFGNGSDPISTVTPNGLGSVIDPPGFTFGQPDLASNLSPSSNGGMAKDDSGIMNFDASWANDDLGNMDWRYLDISLANNLSPQNDANTDAIPAFFETIPMEDMDLMTNSMWNQSLENAGPTS